MARAERRGPAAQQHRRWRSAGGRLVFVRAGKGETDRTTILAKPAVELLSKHLTDVYQRHQGDLEDGAGYVALPYALHRKYPNAGKTHWFRHSREAVGASASLLPSQLSCETLGGGRGRREWTYAL
jgi:hypothetical protein